MLGQLSHTVAADMTTENPSALTQVQTELVLVLYKQPITVNTEACQPMIDCQNMDRAELRGRCRIKDSVLDYTTSTASLPPLVFLLASPLELLVSG